MRFMIYVRPWNFSYYRQVGDNLKAHGCEVSYVSEHLKYDDHSLQRRYMRNLRNNVQISLLGDDVANDMIERCRLLRALPLTESRRHLFAMAAALDEVISSENPSAIVSVTTDSYVIDLIRFLAEEKGVSFVGLIPSFVNGYFRPTKRGELQEVRDPSPEEIQSVICQIKKESYTPGFLINSIDRPLKTAFSRWLKNFLKPVVFAAIRALPSYRYNYHYWASQKVALKNLSISPVFKIGTEQWQEIVAQSAKPVIYAPLQMHPEATVDYWSDNISAVHYEDLFLHIVEKLSRHYLVLIKEHPGVIGLRARKFYRSVSSIENVVMVPTLHPSNDVLRKVDRVFVFTGSVGFEAALRGKVVLTPCRPYYAFGERFVYWDGRESIESVCAQIEEKVSAPVDNEELTLMTKRLLSGLVQGDISTAGNLLRKDKARKDVSRLVDYLIRAI